MGTDNNKTAEDGMYTTQQKRREGLRDLLSYMRRGRAMEQLGRAKAAMECSSRWASGLGTHLLLHRFRCFQSGLNAADNRQLGQASVQCADCYGDGSVLGGWPWYRYFLLLVH